MSTLLKEALGAPDSELVMVQRPELYVVKSPESPETPNANNVLKHDVKRIRIGQYGGRLLLGLNGPAARDLTATPAFWYYMDAVGQIPIVLQPEENIEGFDLFGDKQVVLIPKKLENGERGPNLNEEQIFDFATKCVEGKIVRRWAVPEAEAAQSGVVVCDNREVSPVPLYNVGPSNTDVIAASLKHYESPDNALRVSVSGANSR